MSKFIFILLVATTSSMALAGGGDAVGGGGGGLLYEPTDGNIEANPKQLQSIKKKHVENNLISLGNGSAVGGSSGLNTESFPEDSDLKVFFSSGGTSHTGGSFNRVSFHFIREVQEGIRFLARFKANTFLKS